MDASVILHIYTLAEALLRIEIFTEPFNLILWKAWAVQMHVLLVRLLSSWSKLSLRRPVSHYSGLTARILYDDPAVREDFGLGHPSDGLPDIGTLHLQVETLSNAACELYDVMHGITGRCELVDGTLRWLRIVVEELEVAFRLVVFPPLITSFQLVSD
ncbi:hypothetical protein BKA93DRAFT_749659 [Sparassis latifolia]